MKSENGLITLITGTSRGIGRHLAEHYLQRGHFVIGASRTAPDIANEKYLHFAIDLSDGKAVQEMFNEIFKRFGYISHLINNAGISSLNHFLFSSLDNVKKIMGVNFFATFQCCQEATRLMNTRKFGRIVNFSTIGIPLHSEGLATYVASKAAVEEFTRVLAKEVGPMGITANCIGPSMVDTDMARGVPGPRLKETIAQQAMKRESTAEDVANVIDFFLSEKSEMISAQVIYLGGFS